MRSRAAAEGEIGDQARGEEQSFLHVCPPLEIFNEANISVGGNQASVHKEKQSVADERWGRQRCLFADVEFDQISTTIYTEEMSKRKNYVQHYN